MAIHMITAVPGAGKTLRAVMLACEHMEKNPERPVFSNINGFTRAAPIPDEWMDLPDGSLIILDECQQRWRRYRNTGEPPPEISALETHRHRGMDFILTCQNPSQVTSDVRALVEVHEHLMRRGKLDGAILWRWEGVCHTNPVAHKNDADCEASIWRHPKRYYAEYKSASIHTGTKRLPRILIIAPVVLLGAAASVAWAVSNVTGLTDRLSPGTTGEAASRDRGPAPVSVPADLVTAYGGLRTGETCRLYDAEGRPLLVDWPTCVEALDMGLPYDVERLTL